jgi:hypothetical protein|tara:strand:+ start:1258 stop:1482 length:225 start_codon:yes stop_codon:yes gene_type:complete
MKSLKNAFWLVTVAGAVFVIAWFTFPDKKNRLEFIEERMKDVQLQRKVLTQKEKELEQLATEKEWEEVDKNTNK